MLFAPRVTILFTMIVAAVTLASPTEAFAVTGREAVGICIDSTAGGARCAWNVNDKGEIDVCNQSGCVTCPSADGECKVAAKGRPRPTRPIPVGTTITTAFGAFKVTPRVYRGSLLKALPAEIKKEAPPAEVKTAARPAKLKREASPAAVKK